MRKQCDELPSAWRRPSRCLQQTLFPRPVAKALAELRVSPDDAERWRQLGWLSFHVDKLDNIDEPEYMEIAFIRNLARSGLSDSQAAELLAELEKPYRFDPIAAAYHFQYGWVTPNPDDPYEIIDEHLSDWISDRASEGDTARLQELRDQLDEHLVETEADDSDESKEPEC